MEILLYQDKINAAALHWAHQNETFLIYAQERQHYACIVRNGENSDQERIDALDKLLEVDRNIIIELKLSDEPPVTAVAKVTALNAMLEIAADNSGCDRLERQVNVLLSRRSRLARLALDQSIRSTTANYEATVTNVQVLNSEIKKLLGL